jgi:transporter family protein
LWLAGSAVTTTASWIFYYRAIEAGEVSTVALIDKGSVVVAVLLAYFFLHESVTAVKLAGIALIVSGLLVMTRG